MAKNTSDTNLIRGAAVAYRNYDNTPGMYAGLDKITKVGMDMLKEAKKKKEQEDLFKNSLDKDWNNRADKVLLNSGALGDKLYNFTNEYVRGLKDPYIQGVNEKDNDKRMQALMSLQEHSTFIQSHKQTNLDYAKNIQDKELSRYYLENPKGRQEGSYRTQIMDQQYSRISRDPKTNEPVFHVQDFDGNEVLITNSQYMDMGLPKNSTIELEYLNTTKQVLKSGEFDEDAVRHSIQNSLPTDNKEFIAAMYDDIKGKDFTKMLTTSKSLDKEIIGSINAKAWDDGDGILEDDERANFIDAATNPDNPFFDLEVSKKIMEDQLVNAVRNKYLAKFSPKTTPSPTEVPDPLPPESYDYDDDNIGEGAPMRPGQGSAFTFDASKFNKKQNE